MLFACASRFENRCKSYPNKLGAAVGRCVFFSWSGDAAAFRPMTLCKSAPSPGDVGIDIQLELLEGKMFAPFEIPRL